MGFSLKKIKWQSKRQQVVASTVVIVVLASMIMFLENADYGVTGQAYKVFTMTVQDCADSDGGEDPLTAGVATIHREYGQEEVYSDYCRNNRRLMEFSCTRDGAWLSKTGMSCRKVTANENAQCVEGRCVG